MDWVVVTASAGGSFFHLNRQNSLNLRSLNELNSDFVGLVIQDPWPRKFFSVKSSD